MSTHDARHFHRMYQNNPVMQEQFLIQMLSLRAAYDPLDLMSSMQNDDLFSAFNRRCIEQTIISFVAKCSDWFDPGSQVYADVCEILAEKDPILLAQLKAAKST